MIDFSIQRYAFVALAAAALFGASTPLAKLLLGEMSPVVLAGLLYLGSGLGLGLLRLARGRDQRPREAPLAARDCLWLAYDPNTRMRSRHNLWRSSPPVSAGR